MINYLDIETLGTGVNTKAVVLDSGDDYTWPATGIFTYAVLNDATTTLGATALELNAVADLTARIVTLTGNTDITVALHEGRVILLGEVGGDAALAATLPEATGSGAIFHFIISVANTAEYEVQVKTNDIFDGSVTVIDGDLQTTINAVEDWTAADSDTVNYDSDGICGDVGDWFRAVDIASGIWAVSGQCRSDGDAYTTVWSADQT